MRKVIAAVLFACTGAFLLLSGLVFSNLFDEYKDSEDSFYVEMATIWLVLALVAMIGGILAMRSDAR